MTAVAFKADQEMFNPLDIAEMVMMDREWVCDRPEDNDLIAEASGRWCTYRLWLNWQEDSGLALACALESKLPKHALMKVYPLLAMVNEKLWLGHFDISSEDHAVTFRHSLLVRDGAGTNAEHLQELIDLAIEECERFYPAFQSVVWGGKSAEEALMLSMFETVAEA